MINRLTRFFNRRAYDQAIRDVRADLMNQAALDTYSDSHEVMRFDHGWASARTGQGTSADKAESYAPFHDTRRPRWELDSMYRSSGLIQTIVDLPVADATRGWITLQHPDSDTVKLIQDGLDTLGIFHKVNRAMRYGRIFRLGVVFLDIDDGQPLDQPVAVDRIKSINLASVHDSDYIQPYGFDWHQDEPTLYSLTSDTTKLVHRDRLLIFSGYDAGYNNRLASGGVGESVIDAIYRPFRNLDVDYNAASTIAKDWLIRVIKMANLTTQQKGATSAEVAAAKRRLKVMQGLFSVINGLVMDAADSFEVKAAPLTGYVDLVKLAKDYLCWVTKIPHSKLFKEGPGAGLNTGKGESEANDWANQIDDLREHVLRPQLNKIVRYLAALYKVKEPVRFEFPPMNALSAKEEAEIRLMQAEAEKFFAEADQIRLSGKVVNISEIRRNRFLEIEGELRDRFTVESEDPPEDQSPTPPSHPPGPPAPPDGGPGRGPSTDPDDPDTLTEDGRVLVEIRPGQIVYRPAA